jgi:hypothetical protein
VALWDGGPEGWRSVNDGEFGDHHYYQKVYDTAIGEKLNEIIPLVNNLVEAAEAATASIATNTANITTHTATIDTNTKNVRAALTSINNIEQLLVGDFQSTKYKDNDKIGVKGWLTDNGADCEQPDLPGQCTKPNKTFMEEIRRINGLNITQNTIKNALVGSHVPASKDQRIPRIETMAKYDEDIANFDIEKLRKLIEERGINTPTISQNDKDAIKERPSLANNLEKIRLLNVLSGGLGGRVADLETKINALEGDITSNDLTAFMTKQAERDSEQETNFSKYKSTQEGIDIEQNTAIKNLPKNDNVVNKKDFDNYKATQQSIDQIQNVNLINQLTEYAGHLNEFKTLQASVLNKSEIDDINEWTENHKVHHATQKTEYDSHINAFQTLQASALNKSEFNNHLTQYVGHIKNFQTLQSSTENIDKNLKNWQTSFNKAKGELNVNIKCQEEGTDKWGEEPGQYCPEWLKPKD